MRNPQIIKTAVIPAAGMGKRLRPLTRAIPKPLLPLGRKPVIQHIVEELANAGIEKIVFITGESGDLLEKHFSCSEIAGRDVEFLYIRQHKPLGLGHAVLQAARILKDEQFVVALGDSIINEEDAGNLVGKMIRTAEKNSAAGVIAVQEVPLDEVSNYGIVGTKEKVEKDIYRLNRIVEKPDVENTPSQLAVCARYILPGSIFTALEKNSPQNGEGEWELTHAISAEIEAGNSWWAVDIGDKRTRLDIGRFSNYFPAIMRYILEDEELGEMLRKELSGYFHENH